MQSMTRPTASRAQHSFTLVVSEIKRNLVESGTISVFASNVLDGALRVDFVWQTRTAFHP
jgi:hypothetical protein